MVLLPEEAKLLLDNGVARIIQRPILRETPTESLRNKFEEYRHKLYTEQEQCLIEQRKLQVIIISFYISNKHLNINILV